MKILNCIQCHSVQTYSLNKILEPCIRTLKKIQGSMCLNFLSTEPNMYIFPFKEVFRLQIIPQRTLNLYVILNIHLVYV